MVAVLHDAREFIGRGEGIAGTWLPTSFGQGFAGGKSGVQAPEPRNGVQ